MRFRVPKVTGTWILKIHRPSPALKDTSDTVLCSSKMTKYQIPNKYQALCDYIAKGLPEIRRIYATVVLLRSTNRRKGNRNLAFIRRFNREAYYFNNLLHRLCRPSKLLHVLNHELEWMPAPGVLAADGLHLSYEGVAVMASHIRHLCLKETNSSSSSWADSASVPATGSSPSVLPKIVPSCLKPVDELSHLCCSNSPHNAQSPPVPLVPSATISSSQECVPSNPPPPLLESSHQQRAASGDSPQVAHTPPKEPPSHPTTQTPASKSSINGPFHQPHESRLPSPQAAPGPSLTNHTRSTSHGASSVLSKTPPTRITENPGEQSSARGTSSPTPVTAPGLHAPSASCSASTAPEGPRYQLRKYVDVAKPSSQK
ncbi:hypothetical protein HPB48_019946 [Haemaphysalis longicornis]|uniref:Uncharacterized protein n=1 Tax=Haemaphysalis longicornis TaxID=44386 RepID=A0A9J6H6H2_HAELO|nr:hypothetical protein HPB48_019946 [Haemaphysalis longicornis]